MVLQAGPIAMGCVLHPAIGMMHQAMRGPLPQIRLMPTGGIDLNTAATFLKAGACCLGVGNQLVEPKALAEGNFDRIRDLVSQLLSQHDWQLILFGDRAVGRIGRDAVFQGLRVFSLGLPADQPRFEPLGIRLQGGRQFVPRIELRHC